MSRFPDPQQINTLWPLIGFVLGTLLVGPLILSIEPRERVIGGMLFGGLPGLLVGVGYALYRARRNRSG